MLRYWRKEVGGEIWLPGGTKVQGDFEFNGDSYLSTSVGFLNQQLGLAAQQGIGGISEMSQQDFENIVKKKSSQPESPRRNNLYRANQPLNQNRGVAGAAKASSIEVPVPPKPDPIRVPTADQMKPRRGPIPKEAFI